MEYAKPPGIVPSTPRRMVTAPAPLQISQSQQPSTSQSGSGLVETLYSHPSVKIVAFNAGPRPTFSPGRGASSPVEVEPGTLPWSSQLERTIAVGPFRIYRAPGSVAFLNCGSALQPILPKSQCWCIDEVSSKFVLQIRRPQYWRIEIPVGGGDADADCSQALREVFDKVLQFEKTPCPFQRAFTVELPERPQTPVKKRPWTPIRRTSIQLPPTPITPEDLTPRPALTGLGLTGMSGMPGMSGISGVPGRKGSPDEEVLTPTLPVIERIRKEEALRNNESRHQEQERGGSAEMIPSPNPIFNPGFGQSASIDSDLLPAIPRHLPGFQASRSVTAPPQLSLVTPVPPTSSAKDEQNSPKASESVELPETNSPTDSSDSFHSLQSWHSPLTPLPPSPPLSNPSSPKTFPYPHENIAIRRHVSLHNPQDHETADDAEALEGCVISPTRATDGNESSTALSPVTTGTAEEETASHEDPQEETDSATSEDMSVRSFEDDTITADTTTTTTITQLPSTPTNTSPSTSTAMSTRPRLRHRATTSSISVNNHRALSPLPPAANLFTPHRKFRTLNSSQRATTRLEAVKRIPGAIIHKTCEILLSPPSHLINLMLKVAARIAAGEWRGLVFGVGEGGEKIPVQWDYSDSDIGHWDLDVDDAHDGHLGGGSANAQSRSSSPLSGRTAAASLNPRPLERMIGGFVDDEDFNVDAGQSWEVD